MAQRTDIIAAVDIGTTKIVAIVGKRDNKGNVRILGFGKSPSKGVKRGVVLNIEETSSAIIAAVEKAKQSSGVEFTEVFVGIAGQHIKSVKNRHSKRIESDDHEIKKEDVEQLTSDMYKISLEAGEEIIHVLPENYIVDSESCIKNPVGMFGKKLEANFHIVLGMSNATKNINRCIQRSGLNVIKLVLEPLASADAVLLDDEKEAGIAIIDIGGGTTDLAVYYDGVIRHTAVIPLGGNAVTNDIKEACSILQRQAEALKIQYGSAIGELASINNIVTIPPIGEGREPKEISFNTLANIIQARMEEIIDAVAFEIENSGYMSKLSAGIVITGGGAMLKNLPQLVKYRTGLDVRIGYPRQRILNEGNIEINTPMYATSAGLLLKGMEYMSVLLESKKDDVQTEEVKTIKVKKEGIMSSFKNTLNSLFEDTKDTSM